MKHHTSICQPEYLNIRKSCCSEKGKTMAMCIGVFLYSCIFPVLQTKAT